MPKKKLEECENADKNPICPYISQINLQGEDIKQIKTALVGSDLQSGIVAEIAKLKLMYKILVFVGGTSVASFIALMVKVVFNV